MIVYFSGGAREISEKAPLYQTILDGVWEAGAIIANSWVQGAIKRGTLPEDSQWWEIICSQALKGIEDADIVIVEASGASALGVGYELANALHQKKPTLVLIDEAERFNSYAVGTEHPCLSKFLYSTANVKSVVTKFVKDNMP